MRSLDMNSTIQKSLEMLREDQQQRCRCDIRWEIFPYAGDRNWKCPSVNSSKTEDCTWGEQITSWQHTFLASVMSHHW